jgi:hypothetical protein
MRAHRFAAALANRAHLIAELEPRSDQILCPFVDASIRKGICSIIGRGHAAAGSQKPGGRAQSLTKAC